MNKKQKTETPENLTTEQLGQKMLESVQKMSPEEKAALRQRLNKAFGLNQSLLRLGLSLAQSFQELSPEQQEAARKKMYEQATGKPYRPEQSVGRPTPGGEQR